jgi:ArsR family transcriptional regulator
MSGTAHRSQTGSNPQINDLADTFKALSDETRLQIMTLLLEQEELCVCDFVGALGLTQSKASRHLRYLYHAGLVEDRREGLWMHYRISPHLSAEQATIVEALSKAVGAEQKRDLRQGLDVWLAIKEESRTSDGGESPAEACC